MKNEPQETADHGHAKATRARGVLEAKEKVAKKARLLDDKRAAHAKNKAVTKAFQVLKAEDDLKNAQKELVTAEAKLRTAQGKALVHTLYTHACRTGGRTTF